MALLTGESDDCGRTAGNRTSRAGFPVIAGGGVCLGEMDVGVDATRSDVGSFCIYDFC